MPEIKIDFYQVYFPDAYPGTFQGLMTELSARPAQERTVPVPGGWIHFYSLRQARSKLSGIITRTKADEIPPAANQLGALEDLRLDDNQGLAGLTHFYYHPSNSVLLMQRKANGVRAPSFENYLMRTTEVNVELRPIIQPETMRRLRRLRTIRKIDIKLANPQATVHFKAGRSIESIIHLMNDYEAPIAEVVLTMGYQRGTLNTTRVVRLIQQLFRLHEHGGEVHKIIARGKEHEEERAVVLDLLQDKMVEMAEVPVGENRWLSDRGCERALEEAFERRRKDIEELLGQ